MSTAPAPKRAAERSSALREHDLVRTRAAVNQAHLSLGRDKIGVIVHIHEGGVAYEVEFDDPPCVVTLRPAQIAAA
jgi:hypothetical protein